jgi:DNA polymerase (family 10)
MAFFRPAILDSFTGYSRQQFSSDVLAGITVGVIALPLAMAFAIASGLKPDTILLQHQEIDKLNKKLFPFKIFKGIESDILGNGNLDYEEEILKTFDFIVASVHSNLKMDENKATERLIKAIENPYTTILGHPTGRLLLGRPGYPINHKKIIDACAANNVCIELNAHPYRLDIDWRWIPYCMEKNVMISINPDAHQLSGYHDMEYGTYAARKGMLTKEFCLNAMNLIEFESYLKQ